MRSLFLLLTLTLLLSGALCAEDGDIASTPATIDRSTIDRSTIDRSTIDRSTVDLTTVTDRTDLSFDESPAYYGILAHVRRVPLPALNAAARELQRQRWQSSPRFRDRSEAEFPLFADLIEHPEEYRGQPVTLSGHLIRLVTYPAGPNDEGIDTLYEAWLVTDDSQQHPSTVICTEIPEGMPIGEELIDGVSVTGYFFKLRTYPSRDRKTRFAPMILARTMTWRPPPDARFGWALSPLQLYVGVAAVVVAVSAVLFLSARRRRRLREERANEVLPEQPPDFLKSLTP